MFMLNLNKYKLSTFYTLLGNSIGIFAYKYIYDNYYIVIICKLKWKITSIFSKTILQKNVAHMYEWAKIVYQAQTSCGSTQIALILYSSQYIL